MSISRRLRANASSYAVEHVRDLQQRFHRVAYSIGYGYPYLSPSGIRELPILEWMIASQGLQFEEGIRVLLEYWAKKSPSKKYFGRLPVGLSAMAGSATKFILDTYCQEHYPGGVQWHERRYDAREALLKRHLPSSLSKPPDMLQYRGWVRRYRVYTERILLFLSRSARNYRGRVDQLQWGAS